MLNNKSYFFQYTKSADYHCLGCKEIIQQDEVRVYRNDHYEIYPYPSNGWFHLKCFWSLEEVKDLNANDVMLEIDCRERNYETEYWSYQKHKIVKNNTQLSLHDGQNSCFYTSLAFYDSANANIMLAIDEKELIEIRKKLAENDKALLKEFTDEQDFEENELDFSLGGDDVLDSISNDEEDVGGDFGGQKLDKDNAAPKAIKEKDAQETNEDDAVKKAKKKGLKQALEHDAGAEIGEASKKAEKENVAGAQNTKDEKTSKKAQTQDDDEVLSPDNSDTTMDPLQALPPQSRRKRHNQLIKYKEPAAKKAKPTKALNEIRHYQRTVEHVIPKLPFQRVVREIVQEIDTKFKLQSSALLALHELCEHFFIGYFEDLNLLAMHDRRVTIMKKDQECLSRLKPEYKKKNNSDS